MSRQALKMEPLRTEFMRDITQQLESLFLDAGIDEQTTNNLSAKFAQELAERWQSQLIYIPKNFSVKKALQHAAIRSQFTGDNHSELADKFELHERTIYKIVG